MQFKTTYRKLKVLVTRLLSYGNSPAKIALTITLGIMFGTVPVLGVTTILLALIAISFRLNMVIIQLANYLVYPVQLLLYLPFLRLGSIFIPGNESELNWTAMKEIAQSGLLNVLTELGQLHLWAVVVWFVIWTPLSILLYRLILHIILKRTLISTNSYNR